jgi:hypothetical protein
LTVSYIENREPPPNRHGSCEGGVEHHLTEAAVMIAFAMYLLDRGATAVELHPDGRWPAFSAFDLTQVCVAHPSRFSKGGQAGFRALAERHRAHL